MRDETAICSAVELPGSGKRWAHLFPAGDVVGQDGRAFTLRNTAALVAAFNQDGRHIVVDYEHATVLGRRMNPPQPAPAAGWITRMEARADGVWGLVEWTAKAARMIAAREFRFLSPEVLLHRGTTQVRRILSAGLTHNPNLALTALNRRNDMPDEEAPTFQNALCKALGIDANANEEGILNAVASLKDGRPDPAKYMPLEAVEELMRERAEGATALNASTVKAKVDHAVLSGYITPGMRDWATSLCTADPERFDDFLEAALPAYAHLNRSMDEHFTRDRLDSGGRAPTDDAASIARQLGIDPKALTD